MHRELLVHDRRANVRQLRQEGLSIRMIAERLGCSVGTVHADLNVPVTEEGNTRAVTHGARSEVVLGPLREKHARELREDYPQLDGRRVALVADLLAKIEAGSAWLDRQPTGIVRNPAGEVFAVADRVGGWTQQALRALGDIEREHGRKRSPHQALEAYVQSLQGGVDMESTGREPAGGQGSAPARPAGHDNEDRS